MPHPAPAPENPPTALTFNGERLARRILFFCIAFEVFLVLLDATVNYGRWIDIGAIRRLCNIAREDGFATWFQVVQTFLAGGTLWIICALCRAKCQPLKTVLGWGVLASFFTFMSADDGAKIHERLGTAFKDVFEGQGTDRPANWASQLLDIFPSYAWQIAVLPIFACLGLFMIYFIWRHQQRVMLRALLLAAVGCFAVAVGLDFLEGLEKDHPLNVYTGIERSWNLTEYTVLHFAKSLEEVLEMLGISLLWFVFMSHLLAMVQPGVTFFFQPDKQV